MESHAKALVPGTGAGWSEAGRSVAWPLTWESLRTWLHRPAGVVALEPGRIPCLRVTGRLDGRLGGTLKAQAEAISARGGRRWQIDLSGVRSWNAEGLAALVNALDLSERAGCELALRAPAPAIRRVLERAQLHRMFTITDEPNLAA